MVRESAAKNETANSVWRVCLSKGQLPILKRMSEPGPFLGKSTVECFCSSTSHPVLISGDVKQAFLQVKIHQQDRDALQFHRFKDLRTKTIEVLCFTRVLFGLIPSPFLLRGAIQHHLKHFPTVYPEIFAKIKRSLYVDDFNKESNGKQLKIKATEMLASATFDLHRWHSGIRELELQISINDGEMETIAKQQLRVPRGNETSILKLSCNEEDDTIGENFQRSQPKQ